MREVYRGNGFVIETNDSGEIFVSSDNENSIPVKLRMGQNLLGGITVNYSNQRTWMEPVGYRTLEFKPISCA